MTDALAPESDEDSDDGEDAEGRGDKGSDADTEADDRSLDERVETLADRVAAIDQELAAQRNDGRRSEAELRALIKDELEAMLDDRD